VRTLIGAALAAALLLGAGASAPAVESPRVVEIVAKRFEFAPNEVTVKKGEPVTFRLRTEDVTHGFFSRKLKLDADVAPGQPTDVTITPDAAGTFTVICDHFCGAGHGNMKMKVVVEE
jgi:cytochrome c oxidase subunit II